MANMTQKEDHLLKQLGLKVTLPRLKVLALLQNPLSPHFTAEKIYRYLIEQGEEIGLATVYRVLNQFEEVGLITKHNFEGGKAVFELATQESHDHLICLDCGRVFEFEDKLIRQQQEKIAQKHHLELSDHHLALYGHCTQKNCEYKTEKCTASKQEASS